MSDSQIHHLMEVRALGERLLEQCAEAEGHRIVLDALMAAYVCVAEQHRCCTADAAANAIRNGHRLAEISQQPGHNGPIH